MAKVKKLRMDPVVKLGAFDDSEQIAFSLVHEGGRYWESEAATHIRGLWATAQELAAEVRTLRAKAGRG